VGFSSLFPLCSLSSGKPAPAVRCPLLKGPHGVCGWQFFLRWWLSELLPKLKEATSKDTTTTTDKWNQKGPASSQTVSKHFSPGSLLEGTFFL
jgi:hypothetical protein